MHEKGIHVDMIIRRTKMHHMFSQVGSQLTRWISTMASWFNV
jgi:hypothetical protein